MVTIKEQALRLARQSKSKRMGFGAVLIVKGRKFYGRNRQLKRNEKPPFPVCPWSIHAEQDAIYQALKKLRRQDLLGGLLYVAGIFTEDGKQYIPRRRVSTCSRCYKLRQKYGLKIRIPTRRGWVGGFNEFFSVLKIEKRLGAISDWRRRNS